MQLAQTNVPVMDVAQTIQLRFLQPQLMLLNHFLVQTLLVMILLLPERTLARAFFAWKALIWYMIGPPLIAVKKLALPRQLYSPYHTQTMITPKLWNVLV
jgi:hypothetical protein